MATTTYWRSYIPIPELTYHFWGTNILDHVWWPSEAIRWPFIDKLARMLDRHRSQLIEGLLTVHVLAGAFASVMDLALPFSAGQEAARFIDRHYPSDVWIVGDRDHAASAVAGHLSRPIYYPSSQRFGMFAIWDNKRKTVGLEGLNAQVRELLSIAKKDILLVLNYELSPLMEGLALVRKFERRIVPSEMLYLYVARYGDTGASP